ncbi:MMPL family transporter [Desulfosarcina sp.]|nr:MMPL family transporter [Desulfosarcina sp.]
MFESLLKYRFVVLFLLILITGFSLSKAKYIEIDADVAQFFSEGDTDYEFYQRIKSEFKDEEQLILIGIKNHQSELEEVLFNRILKFSDSLETITNIKKVTGLNDLLFPVKSLFGIVGVPYIKIDDSIGLNFNRIRTYKDFDLTRSFINKNGDVLFLWVEFNDGLGINELDRLFDDVEKIRSDFSDLQTFLWGREYIDLSFKDILVREIKKFGLWMFLFMCAALLMIFKKPLAILFPIILVVVVIIIFLGGMVILSRPLGTMSNLFPTIILIVGVSDVIHFCTKYSIENKNGLSSIETTKATLKEVGWTTFITSFTTAVGFFVLCISPMRALKNFGLESGILVFLTYLITLILLPIFFIGFKKYNLFSNRNIFENIFTKIYKIILHILKYPNQVLITYTLLLFVGIIGIFSINTNSRQYSIPKNSQLWNNYVFYENNFGGSRNFEMVIEAHSSRVLNEPELFSIVYNIHNYLNDSKYLSAVKSPILYYDAMHRAYYPSSFETKTYSSDKSAIKKYENQFGPFATNNYLMNDSKTMFKFVAQMQDLGRNDIKRINNEIYNAVNTIINDSPMQAELTGIDHLIDKSHEKSISNMLIGLLIAILVVGITLGLIFRNLILMFLTLILNLIPLVITAGIMGFTNLELRGEITLIFTVGFVIAVDDTIHLLSKFQWERRRGKDVKTALDLALKECGMAILATSLILIGGFFILMRSASFEIFTLGLLVGIIVLITLSVDLILAPTIILKWLKKYL